VKILLAGDFQFAWYEEACAKALESLGHRVIRFQWNSYFRGLVGKLEHHFVIPGPGVLGLNQGLLNLAVVEQPELVFVWRGVHVWSRTLRRIRQTTKACLVAYNHDDPFSPSYARSDNLHQRRLWSCFRAAIPEYDLNLTVRRLNIEEYLQAGARRVHLLKQFFVPEIHRPIHLTDDEMKQFSCDVVFVGHYEPDGRVECLRALIEQRIQVRLFGSNWSQGVLRSLYDPLGPVQTVYLEEYAKVLNAAKICLAFLSKHNRDSCTSRSFEIPACGALMLSERSPDLVALYQEDQEAVFFSSPGELVEKTQWLLNHDATRKKIAQAGYHQCLSKGHDVVSRMKELIEITFQAGSLSRG